MRRLFFVCLVLAAPCLAVSAQAQTFTVSFPAAQSAKPLDGRVLLLLSNDPSAEPRNQINDSPRSQNVFGITVDGLKPGAPVAFPARDHRLPVPHASPDVPPGDYTVQAVFNLYETFHRGDRASPSSCRPAMAATATTGTARPATSTRSPSKSTSVPARPPSPSRSTR